MILNQKNHCFDNKNDFFHLVFHLYFLLIQNSSNIFNLSSINTLLILLNAKMPFIFSAFQKSNLSPDSLLNKMSSFFNIKVKLSLGNNFLVIKIAFPLPSLLCLVVLIPPLCGLLSWKRFWLTLNYNARKKLHRNIRLFGSFLH